MASAIAMIMGAVQLVIVVAVLAAARRCSIAARPAAGKDERDAARRLPHRSLATALVGGDWSC